MASVPAWSAWVFRLHRRGTLVVSAGCPSRLEAAVGDERDLRIGWDNYDTRAPDGTTIEVKCSAYLQSWTLKRHSELRFGRLIAREFDAVRNGYSDEARVRADVFMFGVQTQRDPAAYDMFDQGGS